MRRNSSRNIIEISPVGFDSIVKSVLRAQDIERAEIEKLNRASRRAMKKNKSEKKHR